MEQILGELEVHIEKHLEDQAILDDYNNPAADLLTRVHQSLSVEAQERKRVEKIEKAMTSLKDILIKEPRITLHETFMQHLVGMQGNPENYRGHAWVPEQVANGLADLVRPARAVAGFRVVEPIQQAVPDLPEAMEMVDREGVAFLADRVIDRHTGRRIPVDQVQGAMRANLSLRVMGWIRG